MLTDGETSQSETKAQTVKETKTEVPARDGVGEGGHGGVGEVPEAESGDVWGGADGEDGEPERQGGQEEALHGGHGVELKSTDRQAEGGDLQARMQRDRPDCESTSSEIGGVQEDAAARLFRGEMNVGGAKEEREESGERERLG